MAVPPNKKRAYVLFLSLLRAGVLHIAFCLGLLTIMVGAFASPGARPFAFLSACWRSRCW